MTTDTASERTLLVHMHDRPAGLLTLGSDGTYRFTYLRKYTGPPVSLTMPVRSEPYIFPDFPPFFDGLLPEGVLLEALLRGLKIDAADYMRQLEAVGEDMVGAVTITRPTEVRQEENG